MAGSRKLILVKHARPETTPEVSSEQWPLSEAGRASCPALADRLRPLGVDVVVTSREPKARQTAELVAAALGVPWEQRDGLHEHDRSNVPHMRTGDFISSVALFFKRPRELALGRETAEQARQRFDQAVLAALDAHPGENLALVTHGTVIALFADQRLGLEPFPLWRRMGLPSFLVVEAPAMKLLEVVERVAE